MSLKALTLQERFQIRASKTAFCARRYVCCECFPLRAATRICFAFCVFERLNRTLARFFQTLKVATLKQRQVIEKSALQTIRLFH